MRHFIDRRQNPKGKSLGNRQRFLRRTRHHLKQMVNEAMKKRSVQDVRSGETVTVPHKTIEEPQFILSPSSGRREQVFVGNKEFTVGDKFPRPGGGGGSGGREGAKDGGGEDGFQFALTRDEFLDILFEDLELPELVKTDLTDVKMERPRRAGHTTSGIHANLNLLRTMRNSYGRRLALRRPSRNELDRLREEIEALEGADPDSAGLEELRVRLTRLESRRRAIAFVEPMDVRYNRFSREPVPNTKAVMFCLMDVSSSMGGREKDLAKRFFILLRMFLERRYESTDVVFVRHTHYAQEVDEETFFYARETGGTVVSTALDETRRIIGERYPTNDWNIYIAQASDGENIPGDSVECAGRLKGDLMRLCQYFAYVEIVDDVSDGYMEHVGGELWRAYRTVEAEWSNFQMRRVSDPAHIYPVFRELFAKRVTA